MRKNILYLAFLAAAFTACDPIEDRDSLSGKLSASDLELTCTPVVVNGKNGNDVVVENNSTILSRWISDRSKIEKAHGTVTFQYIGNREVQFIGLNGDGTDLENNIVEKNVPVRIDTISNIPSDFFDRLSIKKNSDGSIDQTSLPYYFGMASGTAITNSITIEQVVEEGTNLKGNVLKVKCASPVLCDWNWGGMTGEKNHDQLFVTTEGEHVLSLKVTKADGSTETFDLGSYKVEKLTYIPEVFINLFGGVTASSNKTWEWYKDGPCWANGPYLSSTDPNAGWWQNKFADMEGREVGTMTFEFDGFKMSKTVTGGGDDAVLGTTNGTVKIDLSKTLTKDGSSDLWSVGRMYTNGVNVLYGINVNDGNAPYYEYDILKVSKKVLIVAGTKAGTGAYGESWFFKFQVVEAPEAGE